MAIPAELPVGTQDPQVGRRTRSGRMVAMTAQFEARPIQPPPLKLLSIGGDHQTSIALK